MRPPTPPGKKMTREERRKFTQKLLEGLRKGPSSNVSASRSTKKKGGRTVGKTALQRQIEKATGISRYTSGAATKLKRDIYNAARRKSRGGLGG